MRQRTYGACRSIGVPPPVWAIFVGAGRHGDDKLAQVNKEIVEQELLSPRKSRKKEKAG